MGILGFPEWFLLACVGLLLPWAAVRSRHSLRPLETADAEERAAAEARLPPTTNLLASTLLSLLILGLLCWLVASHARYDLLGGRPIDLRALLWGLGALALQLGLLAASYAMRTPEELRRQLVRHLTPRTGREWLLMIAVILAAGFAEEAAYRGLGMLFLVALTGSAWLGALALSAAFAVAHAVQGRLSRDGGPRDVRPHRRGDRGTGRGLAVRDPDYAPASRAPDSDRAGRRHPMRLLMWSGQ